MGLGSHEKDVFQIHAFGFDRPGVRTRCNEQSVKLQGCAVLDHHPFLIHIDFRNPVSQHSSDFQVFVKAVASNGEFVRGNLSGQNHTDHGPAIRCNGLIRYHGDAALGINLPYGFSRTNTGDTVSQNYVFHKTPFSAWLSVVEAFRPLRAIF